MHQESRSESVGVKQEHWGEEAAAMQQHTGNWNDSVKSENWDEEDAYIKQEIWHEEDAYIKQEDYDEEFDIKQESWDEGFYIKQEPHGEDFDIKQENWDEDFEIKQEDWDEDIDIKQEPREEYSSPAFQQEYEEDVETGSGGRQRMRQDIKREYLKRKIDVEPQNWDRMEAGRESFDGSRQVA